MNESFYGEVLSEHFTHPQYQGELTQADCSRRGVNPSCGDDLTIMIKFAGDVISQISFLGEGCALSRAAADIVCQLLTGKTRAQALELIAVFGKMLAGETLTATEQAELGDALSLQAAAAMPLRVKCVQLAWQTAGTLLREQPPATAA